MSWKSWFKASVVAGCFCACVGNGYANPFALYEGGPAQVGSGDISSGDSDRPSVLFYNPAGITQLKGNQVEMGAA